MENQTQTNFEGRKAAVEYFRKNLIGVAGLSIGISALTHPEVAPLARAISIPAIYASGVCIVRGVLDSLDYIDPFNLRKTMKLSKKVIGELGTTVIAEAEQRKLQVDNLKRKVEFAENFNKYRRNIRDGN